MFVLLLVTNKECNFFGGFNDPYVSDLSLAVVYSDARTAALQSEHVLKMFPSVKLCIPMRFEAFSRVLLNDFFSIFWRCH